MNAKGTRVFFSRVQPQRIFPKPTILHSNNVIQLYTVSIQLKILFGAILHIDREYLHVHP
mgnify:FL=1